MECQCKNCDARPCSINVVMKLNIQLQQALDAERALLETAKDQIVSLRKQVDIKDEALRKPEGFSISYAKRQEALSSAPQR